MSVHVLSWVWKHSDERLGRRLVLLTLADHAHDDGTNAFPSVGTIAAEARLSDRQVQNCLRGLEASGSIVPTGKRPSGTIIYSVVMGGVKTSGGCNLRHAGVKSTTRATARISPEPSFEPSVKDRRLDESQDQVPLPEVTRSWLVAQGLPAPELRQIQ